MHRAYTLVEALIAVAIIGIVAAAIASSADVLAWGSKIVRYIFG